MRYQKVVVITVATALSAALAGCADNKSGSGGAKGADSVTIGLSNQENQNYLPLILADRLGFFKKQGLDVKVTNMKDPGQVNNAMVNGQIDGSVGFYDKTMDLQAKHKHTQAVIQLLQAPGMVAMARKGSGVDSPKDYGGKTIGVTGMTGSTAFLSKYLAVRNGVPDKRIKLSEVAAGPTFVSAFDHKEVDAGTTTEPAISSILKKKLGKIIADMRTPAGTKAAVGGPYPGTAMAVRQDWAKDHKATVQKMVNAMYGSLQWMQTHSAKQITAKVPADFYKGPGKKAYQQALANQMGMFSPNGQMPTDGPQSVYRVLRKVDPVVKGKKIDLAKTYTDSYVQKAAKEVKPGSK